MQKTTLPVAGLLIASATLAAAETPGLTIYTYDSFVPDWGPGPAIAAGFEESCGCEVEFVAAGDGASLLSRLLLEGPQSEADIVVGLDTNLIARARESGLIAPHGVEADFDLPIAWDDPDFLPYDWGYFAFVADAGTEAPADFQALAESDLSVVIQDPRSSTPGLGLLMWVKAAHGADAPAIWEGLADNILTVTPGWSEAYGLFLEGEADAVLSYTTSPAYHLIAEEDASKVAWAFDEGHYMQVEVAAMVAGTDTPDLARDFLAYLVSDPAQSVLPTTNWMYPAVTPEAGLPEGFETLIAPERALLFSAEEALSIRDAALEEWRTALSQ